MALAAFAAGCGEREPAATAQASTAEPTAAATRTCGPTASTSLGCAPRRTATDFGAGAPVYDVYANGNRPSLPALEVAALAPPANQVEEINFDVDVKLDPAVVPKPVSGR